MFEKTKLKLKNRLRTWLEIDFLEDKLNRLDDETYEYQLDNNKKFKECNNKITVLHNTIENIVHIGTDVDINRGRHSWAVVCIEGKMNIVKFVDLNQRDARDVLSFLRQFEGGRHCIDAPCSAMFYDGLFKFD